MRGLGAPDVNTRSGPGNPVTHHDGGLVRGMHADDGAAQERFATVEELLASEAGHGPEYRLRDGLGRLRRHAPFRLWTHRPHKGLRLSTGAREGVPDSAS